MEGSVMVHQKLNHAVTCVFHQDQVRHTQLAGPAIHFAHLGCGQNLHARTSASICSNLCRLALSPMTMRKSPPSISASAGGLNSMRPSDLRIARTMPPSSLRIRISSRDLETSSLEDGTRTCSIPTSRPMLLVVKSMNWKTCGFNITCAMR